MRTFWNGSKVMGVTATGNTNYGIRESGTSDYTMCVGNYAVGNTAGAIDVDASGSVNQHNQTS